MPPSSILMLTPIVYKASLLGFRSHAIRVRRNRGLGQCFWRSTVDQSSWYKRKSIALQQLLPSTIHFEQGSDSAWATHTEIAAYAQDAAARVVVISPSQGCVYCFEPAQVLSTVYILHHHDHFEQIANLQGKAFQTGAFHTCHFQGGPDLFPVPKPLPLLCAETLPTGSRLPMRCMAFP